MAFCSKCGAPIADGEKTCSACGSAVRDFAANAKIPPNAPPAFHENATPTVRPKFCGKCGAAVCGEESVCGACGAEIKAVPARFYSQEPDWTAAATEKIKATAKNIKGQYNTTAEKIKKKYNVLSIVCLVTSFLPLFLLEAPTICLAISSAVIIMGIVALNQIKNSGLDGKIFAVFGIIVGSVGALISVVILVILYIINYTLGSVTSFWQNALGITKDMFNNFLVEAFDALINSIMS